MDKQKWISDKISELVSQENRPRKQAVAMAYAMWDNNNKKEKGGRLKSYQGAGYISTQRNMLPSAEEDYNTTSRTPLATDAITKIYGDTENRFPTTDELTSLDWWGQMKPRQNPTLPQGEWEEETPEWTGGSNTTRRPAKTVSELEPNRTPRDLNYNATPTTSNQQVLKPANFTPPQETEANNEEENANTRDTLDLRSNQEPQYNPYGSIDIATAANLTGRSIESGSTLGTVAGGLKVATGVARNLASGMGMERRNDYVEQEARRKNRENIEGQQTYGGYEDGGRLKSYQDGGTQEQMLTGEYLEGASEDNKTVRPTAELEKGEHVLTPEGESTEIIGDTHEKGGEEVELDEGDMVISDHLKLGGKNAKQIRDKFDIKVKAKSTYADAVDKIKSKLGIDKLTEEEEKVLSKIKEEEKVKDDSTREINLQHLYGKRDEILKEKEEIDPQRVNAMKEIFLMQEASKPKEEKQEYEDGGLVKILSKYGIKDEDADKILKEYKKGGYKEYKEGDVIYSKDEDGNVVTMEERSQQIQKELDEQERQQNENKDVTQTPAFKNWFASTYGGDTEQTESVNELPEASFKTPEIKAQMIQEYYDAPDTPNRENTTEEDKEDTDVPRVELLPDQSALPPSGVSPQVNIQRRYDRLEPQQVSPEDAIVENQRQSLSAMDSLNNLSDSQRVAALMQLSANTQTANQNAISQAAKVNAQLRGKTDAQNANIQMRAEDARAQDALSFEKRQQTAEAITDENVRNFFEYMRDTNTQKFNDRRQQTTLNQLFDKFETDSQGNLILKDSDLSDEDRRIIKMNQIRNPKTPQQ